jgi:hypothetical protein
VVQKEIAAHVDKVQQIHATLNQASGSSQQRQAQFDALRDRFQGSRDVIEQHFAKVMTSFEPGLFVGGDAAALPQDNLDLERWFRQPKSHERRIHGHKHAGVRIVQEGPTLLLALDAHAAHPQPFSQADLTPYKHARPPSSQQEAIHRRRIMRKARSRKNRQGLLAELERRYIGGS